MNFPLAEFEAFCRHLRIPSKESPDGSVPLVFLGTQREFIRQLIAGLERGVHDFYILKARQLGISTICQALALFWCLKWPGVQGQVVVESDDTLASFRDVIREMLASLPPDYSLPKGKDDEKILRWEKVTVKGVRLGGSRLMYQVAGNTGKKKGRLGRSRGLSFLLATELGSWGDEEGVKALRASLAQKNPRRLYLWESTARSYNLWHDMWTGAVDAIGQCAIFIGWYFREDYCLEEGTALYDAYATDPPTPDERQWIEEVLRRYAVTITAGQLGWWRWRLLEEFDGDEAMCLQEYPHLPEDAFQAFGSKFIRPATLQRLRISLADAPTPTGYEYHWATRLDFCEDPRVVDVRHATLRVWEEPDPLGAYLVGAIPRGSHDPDAVESAATVWRIYPDTITQVAEYVSEDDATYQFAWMLLHVLGAYNQYTAPFLALELQGTGRRVYEELERFLNEGFGLSEAARASHVGPADFLANVRHYLYRRADSMTRTASRQWLGTPALRTLIMHELRDQVERDYLVIRSPRLLNELAMLRQAEDGDGDTIAGGGRSGDSLAASAAIAVRHYAETALPEISSLIPPKAPPTTVPKMEQVLVATHFSRLMATGGKRR